MEAGGISDREVATLFFVDWKKLVPCILGIGHYTCGENQIGFSICLFRWRGYDTVSRFVYEITSTSFGQLLYRHDPGFLRPVKGVLVHYRT